MSEDEKGKHFLLLIEKQNKLQWDILQKLSFLINKNWDSVDLKKELESLMDDHKKISSELNSLDSKNSLL
ncbi:MAG: hypothetical protein R3327_01425 [Nitrosopumilaceae archaeon]|nr:hypothetical protein [Nitrosopumilaceae archaeon]